MPSLWISLILKENSNVAESAVVNASPLIFLSRAGLTDLLQLISAEVIVPESVATEIEARGKRDPTAHALADTSWLVVNSRFVDAPTTAISQEFMVSVRPFTQRS